MTDAEFDRDTALVTADLAVLKQVVEGAVTRSGHRLLVGSAEQVADDLEDWFRAGAADGFTVMPADTAVDFEAFARLVVPILVERGLFEPAAVGSTLRERLGLGSGSDRLRLSPAGPPRSH